MAADLPSSGPAPAVEPNRLRNIAIIAHVDHGKTTLVDKLLQASDSGGNGVERVMDSLTLEKERGITIMSKCTRLEVDGHVLNVVDTPGHADFGGEVERVLSMVDGVLLVVDATEGPMSQTKFVLGKALTLGLTPVVVLNKADRPTARLGGEVENEVFDLFVALGANDDQLDYPTLFASAKAGWATGDAARAMAWAVAPPPPPAMAELFDTVLRTVPAPAEPDAVDRPFAMTVNNIGSDQYLGPLATGKIVSGFVEPGKGVKVLQRTGRAGGGSGGGGAGTAAAAAAAAAASGEPFKVTSVFITRGQVREPLGSAAGAGDIVTIAGVPCGVGDTVTCAIEGLTEPLETPALAPPTLAMTFGPNDGPLGGKEGKLVSAAQIKARLLKETENNVTLTVTQCATDAEKVEVHGRGELQLGILMETMRREGFELCVSPPRILTTKCPDTGDELEPVEEVTIDVDAEYSGLVIDRLTGSRKGVLIEMKDGGEDKQRLVFHVATRGLLGFGPETRADTRGSAVINSVFSHRQRHMGSLGTLSPPKLVCMAAGKATAYALHQLQERGRMFVGPGEEVYDGVVIGENSRGGDMEVNPTKGKKTTNVRSVMADEALRLAPPVRMTVEELVAYMGDDEMIEITPSSVRLRKAALDATTRARNAKKKKLPQGK
ncbi:unnamed protein product [Phaeothamnion confervicola]